LTTQKEKLYAELAAIRTAQVTLDDRAKDIETELGLYDQFKTESVDPVQRIVDSINKAERDIALPPSVLQPLKKPSPLKGQRQNPGLKKYWADVRAGRRKHNTRGKSKKS
jgi:hypothetical protein